MFWNNPSLVYQISHHRIPPLAPLPSCSNFTHLSGSCPLGQPNCSLTLASSLYRTRFILITITVVSPDCPLGWLWSRRKGQLLGSPAKAPFHPIVWSGPAIRIDGTFWWQFRQKGNGNTDICCFFIFSLLAFTHAGKSIHPVAVTAVFFLIAIRTSFNTDRVFGAISERMRHSTTGFQYHVSQTAFHSICGILQIYPNM